MEISKQIKKNRRLVNLTQKDLGDLLNVSDKKLFLVGKMGVPILIFSLLSNYPKYLICP